MTVQTLRTILRADHVDPQHRISRQGAETAEHLTIGAEANRCTMNKKSQLTVSVPGMALLFFGFVLLYGARWAHAHLATLQLSDAWDTPILIMEIVAFWTAVAAFIASAVVQIRASRQWARRSNEISK